MADQNVPQTEYKFRVLADNSPDMIAIFDSNLRITYISPAVELLLGKLPADVVGKTPLEFGMPAKQYKQWAENLRHTLNTGEQGAHEFFLQSPGGKRFFHGIHVPLFGTNGEVEAVMGVAREITERIVLEQKKEEFIAVASHELKTPLTSLKGYVQLLQRKYDSLQKPEIKEILGKLDEQANRLTELVNEMLDQTRIIDGKLRLNRKEFDLNQLVKEVADEVEDTEGTHSVALELNGRLPVKADRNRISQVLMNLLSNAMKYSPGAQTVEVSTRRLQNEVRVEVRDYGFGISKRDQKDIFKRFHNAQAIPANELDGIGLGLYITDQIVSRHGGRIWVDSEPKRGSTFGFSLPLVRSAV